MNLTRAFLMISFSLSLISSSKTFSASTSLASSASSSLFSRRNIHSLLTSSSSSLPLFAKTKKHSLLSPSRDPIRLFSKTKDKDDNQTISTSNKKKLIYVIVESPAKARTLSKFLPSNYIVDSCVGHVRDLGRKSTLPNKYASKYVIRELNLSVADFGIDVDDNFTPLYQTIESKIPIITRMKTAIKSCDEILLATDEDREGEAISWHLLELLQPKIPVRRAVFHEITEKAILDSFAAPRDLNYNVVASQEARRMLDRLVGFTLSPILWKFVGPNLSAGRVQSCGLYMCVEKEKSRWKFVPSNYYSLKASFSASSAPFLGRLVYWKGKKVAVVDDFDSSTGELKVKGDKTSKTIILDQNETQDIIRWMNSPDTTFVIDSMEKKKVTRNPPAAFTTSTLQQECSSQLKLSPTETMALAQSLYENSHITYMRTDSATLGHSAQEIAVSTIARIFSKEYVHSQYLPDATNKTTTTKKKSQQLNAQEAHEAIRPTTKLMKLSDGTTREVFVEPNATGLMGLEKKLYELIYQRVLASVMSPAVYETSTLNIKGKSEQHEGIFRANEKRLIFSGFQAISGINKPLETNQNITPTTNNNDNNKIITNQKPLQVGDQILLSNMIPTKTDNPSIVEENEVEFHEGLEGVDTKSSGILVCSHKTFPPLRYNEASFIRELEIAGVGRPSTYASIIQTLEDRGYILVDKRTIIPTVKGIVVSNLLLKYFPEIILPEFTSKMESNLDLIAHGKIDRVNYLKSFYLGDHTSVLNPIYGLKSKVIEVNNNKNNFTSYDYKILNINNLLKYGKLIYTGEEDLILEKEITNSSDTSAAATPTQPDDSTSASISTSTSPSTSTIQRWKLPIAGDLRKLNEEYLEKIQNTSCEMVSYNPAILPSYHHHHHRHYHHQGWNGSRGLLIGVWNNQEIFLREGKYGPYLEYGGINCAVGKNASEISLNEAISLIEKKLHKMTLPTKK